MQHVVMTAIQEVRASEYQTYRCYACVAEQTYVIVACWSYSHESNVFLPLQLMSKEVATPFGELSGDLEQQVGFIRIHNGGFVLMEPQRSAV